MLVSRGVRLLFPFFRITVALKTNRFGGDNRFFQYAKMASSLPTPSSISFSTDARNSFNWFAMAALIAIMEAAQLEERTCGTELETISGECERRGAVTVGSIQ
jgi:hypothetical protein